MYNAPPSDGKLLQDRKEYSHGVGVIASGKLRPFDPVANHKQLFWTLHRSCFIRSDKRKRSAADNMVIATMNAAKWAAAETSFSMLFGTALA